MYCSYCGTQLPDSSRFCQGCGKPTVVSDQNQMRPVVGVKKRSLKGWIIVSVVCLGLFLLSAMPQPETSNAKQDSTVSISQSKPNVVSVSLGQIVKTMNSAPPLHGKKFIISFDDSGPFTSIDLNPALWEALTPLQQKAFGTSFAKAFGGTGKINCRIKVYGIEVGHVNASLLDGWTYEAR